MACHSRNRRKETNIADKKVHVTDIQCQFHSKLCMFQYNGLVFEQIGWVWFTLPTQWWGLSALIAVSLSPKQLPGSHSSSGCQVPLPSMSASLTKWLWPDYLLHSPNASGCLLHSPSASLLCLPSSCLVHSPSGCLMRSQNGSALLTK